MCTRWRSRPALSCKSAYGLILSLSLGLSAPGSRAADDVTRFLAVTNWHVTYTHHLTEHGTLTYPDDFGNTCTATWGFDHGITVSSQLSPDPGSVGLPTFRQFNWRTNDSFNISIQDRFRETCIDSKGESTTRGLSVNHKPGAPEFLSLLIDTAANSYTLFLPPGLFIPQESEILFPDGSTAPGNIPIELTPLGAMLTNSLPGSGMTIQGQKSFPMRDWYLSFTPAAGDFIRGDPRFGGMHPLAPSLLSGTVVVTWTLTPQVEELELVIESDRYEEWLPLGDLRDWRKPGDILYLTAVLQTKDGEQPQSRATKMKFELMEVSNEKGVCMNRPIEQFANMDPDLKFQPAYNGPPFVTEDLDIDEAGMTAVTPEGEYDMVEAGVSCFDFGARGKIKVTATVNGKEIVGYWQNDPAKEPKPLLLPRRQEDSWIADAWKEDQEVGGLEDSDDEENEPVGDTHTGDGLSMYEEYRGFSENLKHMRANPRKKDLFIADNIRNADSMGGVAVFAAQTGLEVHGKMRTEEFHVNLAAGVYSSFVNFNHSGGERHIVDQHGVILLAKSSSDGVSRADGPVQGGTPGFYERVLIDRAAYGWQTVGGGSGPRILTFKGAGTVAHELAHTCTVWHHGHGDEEQVVWTRQGNIIRENLLEIEPRRERGGGFSPLFGTNSARTVWLGVRHGQHSGHMDCLMRYANAYAYRSRLPGENHVRYVVDEIEGIVLCEGPNGTGVNASSWLPHSRYEQAADGRGDCKGQICVNDRHGRHIR